MMRSMVESDAVIFLVGLLSVSAILLSVAGLGPPRSRGYIIGSLVIGIVVLVLALLELFTTVDWASSWS